MTSRTCGIFKSSCRVKLDTYQGGVGDHAVGFLIVLSAV